jgi:hypothetical protein
MNSGITQVEMVAVLGGIPDSVFENCRKLTSFKTSEIVSGMVLDVGMRAFYYCESLVDCIILGNVENVGHEAFYHCDSLHHIDLPEGLEEIGSSAFAYSGLKSIYLPSTLGWISDCAFKFCTDLISVIYNGTKNDFLNKVMKSSRWDEDVKIHSISCRDGILQWQ